MQDSSPDVSPEMIYAKDHTSKPRHQNATLTIKSTYEKKKKIAQNIVTMTNSKTSRFVFNHPEELPDLFGPFRI